MQITMTTSTRLAGGLDLAQGQDYDLPDATAQLLIRNNQATTASKSPARKKADDAPAQDGAPAE